MPEASQQVRDEAHFVRPRHLPGVELVSVAYRNRSFPVHTHPEYVIGAVVAGAETLSVRGVSHLLAAGSTLFLPPDEPHANATAGEARLRYRVLYVSAAGLPATMVRGPTSAAPHLFEAVVYAHEVLSQSDDRLEQETTLHGLIGTLSEGAAATSAPASPPHRQMARVRDYIDAHFGESFGLAALADVAGLSPFHMLRTFKQEVGLTPLAYRNQKRLAEARRLLRDGYSVADTALAVGFADQSHLTRQFQRVVGVSPGRYTQQ